MRTTSPIAIGLALLLGMALPAAAQEAAPEAAAAAESAEAAPEAETEEAEAAPKAEPLPVDAIRRLVDQQLAEEAARQQERLELFRERKAEQERKLAEAAAAARRAEAESQRLEQLYTDNETRLEENHERLEQRLGEIGELFGVVRQVATDTSGHVFVSLTSAELGPRKDLLERLGRSKELPTTRDLERLWYELQREMTAQSEVVRFEAPVLTREEGKELRQIVRAGPFVAMADGHYLAWKPAEGLLSELPRQPPGRYLDTVEPFVRHETGFVPLAVDPSRGILLRALTETPSLAERISQGGYVGYVILSLGGFGLALGFGRWLRVTQVRRRVLAQQRSRSNRADNPLGRLRAAAEESPELDSELLELKLDDIVMREANRITRFLWIVRTASVIAPLLGLLGTVTGMIQTFQAITLYGAGDPKMMAGGISEALVTTMLGLIAAIPMVLLYETLANGTRQVAGILEENAAALVADRSHRDAQLRREL